MNTDNSVDQLFRTGLEGGKKEPPPGLWDKIAAGIPGGGATPTGGNKSRKMFWWWTGAGTAILCIAAWLLLHSLPEQPRTGPVPAAHSISASLPDASFQSGTTPASPVISQLSNAHPLAKPPAHPSVSAQTVTEKLQSEIPVSEKTSIVTEVSEQHKTSQNTPPETLASELPVKETSGVSEEKASDISTEAAITHAAVTIVPEDTAAQSPPVNAAPSAGSSPKIIFPNPFWGITLQVAPQFYKPLMSYQKSPSASYEAALLGHSDIGRFRLSAGIGYAIGRDKNRWKTVWLKTDTISEYKYVTSVNFQPVYNPIDSTITGYVPTNIVTVNHPVIDTQKVEVTHDLFSRYHYVQVPVMLGYDVWSTQRLTLGVTAGVIYHYQIFESSSVPVFPDETLISSMVREGLTRRESWWQYQAGLQVRYDLGKNWFTEGSVVYRRPFSSWYKSPAENGTPAGLLIHTGVGIVF